MISELKKNLPTSWVKVKLGEFVESEKGRKPKNQSKVQTDKYTLPYVDIAAFEKGEIRSWTDGKGCRICYESDFLMVWDGSRSGLVGKGMHGALGSTLMRINFPGMNNQYAYYYLQSKYQEINTRAKGSGTPHVDPDLLWNYEFPIAPLEEQKRIVSKIEELFSELDNGIAVLETAREQLKVYRQAVLKHAFEGKLTAEWRKKNHDKLETSEQLLRRIKEERNTLYQKLFKEWKIKDKEWKKYSNQERKPTRPIKPKDLGKIDESAIIEGVDLPKGWIWIRVGDIALVGTGVTPLKSNSSYYESGDIAWVTSGALNEPFVRKASDYVTVHALNETSLRMYSKHTLVVALYGEGRTRGKCSELLIEATTNQAIAAIMLEGESSCLRSFVKWYLTKKYEEMRLLSSGGVQPNLNLGIIENMLIPLCSIEESKQISFLLDQRFSEIDKLDSEIEEQIEKSVILRQSILKKAFSGELVKQDLREESASELLSRIKKNRKSKST